MNASDITKEHKASCLFDWAMFLSMPSVLIAFLAMLYCLNYGHYDYLGWCASPIILPLWLFVKSAFMTDETKGV